MMTVRKRLGRNQRLGGGNHGQCPALVQRSLKQGQVVGKFKDHAVVAAWQQPDALGHFLGHDVVDG